MEKGEKLITELVRASKMRYGRATRKQVVEKFTRWIEENEMKAEPSFPVGEYLGDIEVTDEMLAALTNINPFVNSIRRVQRGTYIVYADFDYAGDGKFLGLRLEPLRDDSPTEKPVTSTPSARLMGTFAQGGR
jgi:hypothetical protein